jgi:GNAT superfamily N-acetyltransferase
MIELNAQEIPKAITALFRFDVPAGHRLKAALNGDFPFRIFADNPMSPTWAVLLEFAFDTIYPAGMIDRPLLKGLIRHLCQEREVLLGLWHDDPLITLVPDNPDYQGKVIDYTDRQGNLNPYLQIPEDCNIQRVDLELLQQSSDKDFTELVFGSLENALHKGLGFYLLQDGKIACESFGGPVVDSMIEIGVQTHKSYRQKGYALATCAHLIQECENLGYQTYWNCNASNTPSVKLAQKLGYQTAQEYTLFAWSKSPA